MAAYDPRFEPVTAERIARNESIFRDANEGVARAAEDVEARSHVPFLCECADPACRALVPLALDDYRRVRSSPRWFLCLTGHQRVAAGLAQTIEAHDGWDLVEKTGEAGAVAEELASERSEVGER